MAMYTFFVESCHSEKKIGKMSNTYDHVTVGLLWALMGFAVAFLVWYYASYETPWYVKFAVFVGWVFPFSIVLVLPLDLTSTFYDYCLATAEPSLKETQCLPPLLYVSDGFLWVAWRAVYWTMFVLTYLTLPLVNGYANSGYFKPADKLRKAIRDNLIYYGIMAVLGVVVVILAAAYGALKDPKAFLGIIMTIANLFGLSIVVLLLSHGVIDVPRSLWYAGNPKRQLHWYEFKVFKIRHVYLVC
jgi:hypothetical protein